MNIARHLAEAGARHGTVIVTNKQSGGRGQHGRRWRAKRGKALLCSIIIHPEAFGIPIKTLQIVPLLIACAVHQMLQEELSIIADIRWPNDILVDGQKVCGILSEYYNHTQIISVNSDNAAKDDVHNKSGKQKRSTAHCAREAKSTLATTELPRAYIVVGIGINCCQRYFSNRYNTKPTSLHLIKYRKRDRDSATRLGVSFLQRLFCRDNDIAPQTLIEPLVRSIYRKITNPHDWNEYINMHLWKKGEAVTVQPGILRQRPFAAQIIKVAKEGSLCYTQTRDSKQTKTNMPIDSCVEHLYAGSIR